MCVPTNTMFDSSTNTKQRHKSCFVQVTNAILCCHNVIYLSIFYHVHTIYNYLRRSAHLCAPSSATQGVETPAQPNTSRENGRGQVDSRAGLLAESHRELSAALNEPLDQEERYFMSLPPRLREDTTVKFM